MLKHIPRRSFYGITTSERELKDLLKAWGAISIAFAILFTGTLFSAQFFIMLLVSALTAGVGFLFHELAHKVVAQRYGCHAEFRSQDSMLIMAIIFSFMGFIFAAPGAVIIHGQLTTRANGKVSAAGPAMNFLLAIMFFAITFIPYGLAQMIGTLGMTINVWLGLFNMIPFWVLDGKKILQWNKYIWGAMVAAGIVLLLI